jgi:hypothetical protein
MNGVAAVERDGDVDEVRARVVVDLELVVRAVPRPELERVVAALG